MKRFLVMLLAAATFSAAITEAANHNDNFRGRRPGRPGPGRPPGHGGGPGYPPPPPPPARPAPPAPVFPAPPTAPGYGTIAVPIYVNRYFVNNDRLDLAQYVNLAQYRGLRLVGIDLTAQAQFNFAQIDFVVNGFQAAPTLNLNTALNPFRVFVNQNIVLGYGPDNITLFTRGNLAIQNIVLQLSR